METETLPPSLPPLVSFQDDLDLDDDKDLVVDNPLSHGCQPGERTLSPRSSLVVSEWLRILSGNKEDKVGGKFVATTSHNYNHSSSSGSNDSSSSSRRWATDETFTTINTAKATMASLHLPIRRESPTIHIHRKKPTTINGEPHDGPIPCPVRKVSMIPGGVEEDFSSAATTPLKEQEGLLIPVPKPRMAWMSSATSDLLLRYPIIDGEEGEEEDYDEGILDEEDDEYGDRYNIYDYELPSGLRSPRSTMCAIPSTTPTVSEKSPTRPLSRCYKKSLSRTLLSDEPSSKPQQPLKRNAPKKNTGGLLDQRSPPPRPMRQLSKALL